MNALEDRIDRVIEAIDRAALRSGRSADEVELVAVSKTHSATLMNQAADHLRRRGRPVVFGENYLQEFTQKRADLKGEFCTHLIGPLQSNKVARAVQEFDLIQSVHSEKVLKLIDREASKLSKVMPVFLQVNISEDPSKSGLSAAELLQFVEQVLPECPSVAVRGLMTITEFYADAEGARGDFARLRELSQQVLARFSGAPFVPELLALSMGMSADFAVAISEGATHVRVGSAIFGERVAA